MKLGRVLAEIALQKIRTLFATYFWVLTSLLIEMFVDSDLLSSVLSDLPSCGLLEGASHLLPDLPIQATLVRVRNS